MNRILNLVLFSLLFVSLMACKDSQQILDENKEWLQSVFSDMKAVCQQLEKQKQLPDQAFKHSEKLIIKEYSDVELVFENFWFKMKSPANTLSIQSEFCQDYKWKYDDRNQLFQDGLLPALIGTVNPGVNEKYRLSPYHLKESKFKQHMDAYKQSKYFLFHEQLAFKKGKALSPESFESGHFKARLFLYDVSKKQFIGTQTFKVENSSKVNYSSERFVEVYRKEHPDDVEETYQQTVDLGDEIKRFNRAIESDMYSLSHDKVKELLVFDGE